MTEEKQNVPLAIYTIWAKAGPGYPIKRTSIDVSPAKGMGLPLE